jgi:hypothetical protein
VDGGTDGGRMLEMQHWCGLWAKIAPTPSLEQMRGSEIGAVPEHRLRQGPQLVL